MNYRAETTTNPPNSNSSSILPYMDHQLLNEPSSPTNNLFSHLDPPNTIGGKKRKNKKSKKTKKSRKSKKTKKSKKSKKLSA